jgi:hypothetical protein
MSRVRLHRDRTAMDGPAKRNLRIERSVLRLLSVHYSRSNTDARAIEKGVAAPGQ